MGVKTFLHRLELSFWDIFIPIMHKSSTVRYIVPRIYRLMHSKEFKETIKLTLILTVFGLILGFVFGALSNL